jgi:ABC transporter with metal-binding/Fe-S-binding domain ATP-binding protein
MKVAVLYSGGKDSTFALWHALHQGWDVVRLVTLAPADSLSYMFHHPNIRWTALQAKSLGMPQSIRRTAGRKEEELDDLRAMLKPLRIDGVVSGAFASEYQRERLDFMCEELGLRSFSPLWHKDGETYLSELSQNFEVMITSVSAEGFDESWLGRRLDATCINDLLKLQRQHGVSPCGEGGEYETFVLNAPIFRKRIIVEETSKSFRGMAGSLTIRKARLAP